MKAHASISRDPSKIILDSEKSDETLDQAFGCKLARRRDRAMSDLSLLSAPNIPWARVRFHGTSWQSHCDALSRGEEEGFTSVRRSASLHESGSLHVAAPK